MDRVGEEFGVAEGVGDPVGGERVLEITGVADERPARPVGLLEIAGGAGEAEMSTLEPCAPLTAAARSGEVSSTIRRKAGRRSCCIWARKRSGGIDANTQCSPPLVGMTPTLAPIR